MARPLRIEFAGAFYHVVSRGNAKQDIFISDDDRELFLGVLKHVRDVYHWEIYAYCLMNNHYHLFMQTTRANLSTSMRQLNGRYSQRFNRTHDRVGHVFQGRFFATIVQSDAYFLELIRYIVLNPVRAKFVANPDAWRWSSFHEVQHAADAITNVQEVLSWFTGKNPIFAYRQFILDGIGKRVTKLRCVRGVLGDEQFISEVNGAEEAVKRSVQIPICERWQGRPTLNEIFLCVGSDRYNRDKAIVLARNNCGHSVNQIAKHVGLNPSTVSRILTKMSEVRT